MNILLVDDDETLRQSLNLLLDNEGYNIAVATTGEEALERAKLDYFDVVLCDIRMPGIDGLETIEKLKDQVADAHFLVMTGFASEDAPIKALKLGVDDYFTKPFDIPLFLEKLRAIARRRRRLTQSSAHSLGRFISSLREHYPELADHCEAVEEKTTRWSSALGLNPETQEVLRFGSWVHPLAQVKSTSEHCLLEDDLDTTDRLAQLLGELSKPESQELLPSVLKAAVALARGEALPTSLHNDIHNVLDASELPDETEAQTANRLNVVTLGRFETRIGGRLIDRKAWQSANARWLFVYLLTRRCQSVPETRLAEIFWPGSPSKKAHRALVSSVHRARKALDDPELLARYDKSYGIKRDCDYHLDSEELLDAYKLGTRDFYRQNEEQARTYLTRVLDLYQGEFLPSCSDDWANRIRDDLKMKVVDAAEKLAQLDLESDPAKSEHWCRRAIQLESTSEPAWSTLFRALASQGRRSEVESAYRDCVRSLEEELQLKPGARLNQSYQESLQD